VSEHVWRRHNYPNGKAKGRSHPGCSRSINEVGEWIGQHYFSMGFVEGESLADKVHEGPLPPRAAAEWIEQAAWAVDSISGPGTPLDSDAPTGLTATVVSSTENDLSW